MDMEGGWEGERLGVRWDLRSFWMYERLGMWGLSGSTTLRRWA